MVTGKDLLVETGGENRPELLPQLQLDELLAEQDWPTLDRLGLD